MGRAGPTMSLMSTVETTVSAPSTSVEKAGLVALSGQAEAAQVGEA